jgi:hypothetical protein
VIIATSIAARLKPLQRNLEARRFSLPTIGQDNIAKGEAVSTKFGSIAV